MEPSTSSKVKDPSEPVTAPVKREHLPKFTIPKLRRAGKLELCLTDRREYGEVHTAIQESRLDLMSDLQSTWQFGDVKLVRNDDLEQKFSAKRSEMRASGRHEQELQEQFCFLVLPDNAVMKMLQIGLRAGRSKFRALGNPHLGIYLCRHSDVALNHAHNKPTKGVNLVLFKVIFGKMKKIQTVLTESKKAILDPTPNFDCHVSKNVPSPQELLEQQAIESAVYCYDYDQCSSPMARPRQCLPFAVVTARFKGHKWAH